VPRTGLRLVGLAVALALLSGCGKRSCSETEVELEPLAEALEDRLRAKVATLYYATDEYRARVVQFEAFVSGQQPETSYEDVHWRGAAPRILVRASSEPGLTLGVATPGWDAEDLQDLAGRRVLLVVYVPERYVPPPPGQPAQIGRALYVCD
jgi:hypothetical protein